MNKIPLFRPCISPKAARNMEWTLKTGMIAQGGLVDEFETALEATFGMPMLTVNSGTSALHLLYDLAGIKRNSLVISTPMTCAATNIPLLHLGADILWADVDKNGLIDTESVSQLLHDNDGVVAVVGVDYGGMPCQHRFLNSECKQYGTKYLIDAAQSLGAEEHGGLVGKYCWGAAYSFQAIKHLTTGDGGALTVGDPDAMAEGKLKRWFGLDRTKGGFRCEQDIEVAGYKFHMNDIAASMGLANLEMFPDVLAKARGNAEFYLKELSGIGGLHLPTPRKGDCPSWWSFIVQVEDQAGFITYLAEKGVEVAKIHSRNDTKTVFESYRRGLPGVARFDGRQVSLPVGQHVSDEDRRHVVEAVRGYFA